MRWSWIVIIALLLGAAPEAAYAHGGTFAPPPAESGPGGAPGRPTGDPPTHVDPGIGGPPITTPGGPPGLVPDRPFQRRRADATPTFEHSWELWWDINRHALLPRPYHLRPRVVTPGGSDESLPWETERARLAQESVLPFLRSILDPAARIDHDVRGSALLALGKLTDDPKDVEVLLTWLHDEKAKPIVRESAALGLGLLRRTAADQQMSIAQLDPLRGKLLMVWDRRIGVKRIKVPDRTRVFVMYALGLLGDQPFDERTVAKDGALFSGLLWERVGLPYDERELRIAPIVALGLHPRLGLPEGTRAGLEAIVQKQPARGRKWDPYERSHALTAIARIGGPGARKRLLQVLSDARQHDAVALSAALSVGALAAEWTAIERMLAARALLRILDREEAGLLLKGLSVITLARLLDADFQAGQSRLLTSTDLGKVLEAQATRGEWWSRGYGLIGLGIAAKHAPKAGEAGVKLQKRAADLLLDALRYTGLHASARGAAAVGLGLMGDRTHTRALAAIVRNGKADAELRGHAALALGQLRARTKEALEALDGALRQRRVDRLRGRAALALSLAGNEGASKRLLEELRTGRSTGHLAQVTVALGHLGDLNAVIELLESARTAKNDLVRSMAVVALGRLLDPEPQPSMLKILIPANYPARSAALHEALTIL